MAKKKTATELAKSQGISRRYLFYKQRVKEHPYLYAAVKSKKLPLYIAGRLVDADIADQQHVVEANTSNEVRARFKEVQAARFQKAEGETIEYRRLLQAWGKCGHEDQVKFSLHISGAVIGDFRIDDKGNVTPLQHKSAQEKTDH
jgi:hypothetical protein